VAKGKDKLCSDPNNNDTRTCDLGVCEISLLDLSLEAPIDLSIGPGDVSSIQNCMNDTVILAGNKSKGAVNKNEVCNSSTLNSSSGTKQNNSSVRSLRPRNS
ncbi:PiggyBac transposable element-derived protein 3, partial [Frankliniella fusca]